MAAAHGSAVGARRSQPLPDRAGRHRRHAWRTGAAATGRSLPALRGSGSNVNGSWHALVEHTRTVRTDAVVALADAAGHSVVLERYSPSPNPGQGGTISRIAATGLGAAGVPRQNRQAWLDAYRWEHNHVRPHEALGMRTPATLWKPSLQRYDPHPPRWEYPTGAWVLKVDCQGKLDIQGRKWRINRSLAGEWVQVVPVAQRIMVFYCSTLIRELDPGSRRSKIVERWLPRPSSSPPL